jgi:hypothetical protein
LAGAQVPAGIADEAGVERFLGIGLGRAHRDSSKRPAAIMLAFFLPIRAAIVIV